MVTMVELKSGSESLQENNTEWAEDATLKRSLRTRKGQQRSKDYSVEDKRRWTDEEKKKLLNCLEKYGYQDIKRIAAEIPTRTELDIMFSIKYWKRIAISVNIRSIRIAKLHSRLKTRKKLNGKLNDQQVSLLSQQYKRQQSVNKAVLNTESWVDFFEKKLCKDRKSEGIYGLSNIFLIISKFEAHPLPEEADGLDFQELYLWLNDLINGQPMKKLSGPMMKFVADTFSELSEASKASDMFCQLSHINRRIFNSWNPSNFKTYKRNLKNEEIPEEYVKTMNSILSLPDLNPLEMKVDDGLKKMVNFNKK